MSCFRDKVELFQNWCVLLFSGGASLGIPTAIAARNADLRKMASLVISLITSTLFMLFTNMTFYNELTKDIAGIDDLDDRKKCESLRSLLL